MLTHKAILGLFGRGPRVWEMNVNIVDFAFCEKLIDIERVIARDSSIFTAVI
jgi:hypothetical protein